MCDARTFSSRGSAGDLTRRDFTALGIGAAIASMLPRRADALETTLTEVDVETPDGVADGYFAHPVEGRYPGVVIWPDARGMRTAYRQIAMRLAESGFAVLVVNPYYRGQRGPVLPDGTDPRQGDTMSVLRPLLAQLSPETELTDAIAAVGYLESRDDVVDSRRRMGTLGFCLGGPAVFRTAAQFPDRIGAAATFHGVRLVTDAPTSPHRLVPQIDARFLVVIAADDDAGDPEAKRVLRRSFDAAGLAAEIEVYAGAMHSFTTPDSPVHHPEQAERAFSRLLAIFGDALA